MFRTAWIAHHNGNESWYSLNVAKTTKYSLRMNANLGWIPSFIRTQHFSSFRLPCIAYAIQKMCSTFFSCAHFRTTGFVTQFSIDVVVLVVIVIANERYTYRYIYICHSWFCWLSCFFFKFLFCLLYYVWLVVAAFVICYDSSYKCVQCTVYHTLRMRFLPHRSL